MAARHATQAGGMWHGAGSQRVAISILSIVFPQPHFFIYFLLFLYPLRANWPRDGDKSSLSGRQPYSQAIKF